MGSDLNSACCLQDLTELQKERQCLEKQHQQELNKLNQELQQARTLHNALQAQADKVNMKVIKKTKEKQSFCSSRNCVVCLLPPVIFCYFLLSVLFPFPHLSFLPRFIVPRFKDISHSRYDLVSPSFTVMLSVFSSSVFLPPHLLSASSSSWFLPNGKVKL